MSTFEDKYLRAWKASIKNAPKPPGLKGGRCQGPIMTKEMIEEDVLTSSVLRMVRDTSPTDIARILNEPLWRIYHIIRCFRKAASLAA